MRAPAVLPFAQSQRTKSPTVACEWHNEFVTSKPRRKYPLAKMLAGSHELINGLFGNLSGAYRI